MGGIDKLLIQYYISDLQIGLYKAAYATLSHSGWKAVGFNSQFNKLYYILKGEGWIQVGNTELHPKAGDFIFIPAGITHSYSTSEKDAFRKYWCHFTSNAPFTALFNFWGIPYCIRIKETSFIEELWRTLVLTGNNPDMVSSLKAKAALLNMLAFFIECGLSHGLESFSPPAFNKLTSIINYIEENLTKDISVDELAEIAHFHPQHFMKYFKTNLGVTPMHYIYRRRIERAKSMLLYSDMTLNQIAAATGFHDLSHFSKSFKKYFGISPGEFKHSKTSN